MYYKYLYIYEYMKIYIHICKTPAVRTFPKMKKKKRK